MVRAKGNAVPTSKKPTSESVQNGYAALAKAHLVYRQIETIGRTWTSTCDEVAGHDDRVFTVLELYMIARQCRWVAHKVRAL